MMRRAVRSAMCTLRRAAQWYAAGLTATASQLACPELLVHLEAEDRQSRYVREGIEELTAWLRTMPITD